MSRPRVPRVSTDPRGEFPFDLPEYLFHLLSLSLRHRETAMEALLAPLGLTIALQRAMAVIYRFQPCTMGELATYAVVDRTTMTRTVDHLVENGWVERVRGEKNRREVILTITHLGQDKLAEAYEDIFDKNRQQVDGICEDDLRTHIRLAQALAANLAPDPATRESLLTFSRADRPMAEG